jgi:hypothetical protein
MERKTHTTTGRTKRRHILAFLFMLFALPTWAAQAANVFVPAFAITSWVDLDAEIQTRAKFQLAFDGGYKYQAKVAFQYYNLDVESLDPLDPAASPYQALVFDGVQASLRGIFSFLDLTYWTGFYGLLGETKHYRGPLYHSWDGFDYEAYYVVTGTGLILTGNFAESVATDLYVYQRTGTDYINSLDLTFRFAKGPVTFGLYSGASDQVFRAGVHFIYIGNEIEFYLTAGNLTVSKQYSFDFDNFFFLAEEWFKMGKLDLVLSVFARPLVHYNYLSRKYEDTGEQNDIDFNFDLFFTSEKGTFSPGGEFNIRTNSVDDLAISLSPYVSVYSAGLVWKFKLEFNLLSQSRDPFTAYIDLQSSF